MTPPYVRMRRRHTDIDGDGRGIDRRHMRNVIGVAEQQLKRVSAARQRDRRLGLTGAEMKMSLVARNGLIERRQWARRQSTPLNNAERCAGTGQISSSATVQGVSTPASSLVSKRTSLPPQKTSFSRVRPLGLEGGRRADKLSSSKVPRPERMNAATASDAPR